MRGLYAALRANPIGFIIGLIGALVAGFMYLWENSEGFRNFWIGLWEAIKTAASWAWNIVLMPVFDPIGSLSSWVFNNIVAPAIARFRAALRLLGDVVSWLGHYITYQVWAAIS